MGRRETPPLALGTVVRFARKGTRRRYVVASTDQFGQHSVVALSGAWRGSNSSGVAPGDLVVDADQTIRFEGKLEAQFRRNVAFALQLHKHAPWRETNAVIAAWERGERPALPVPERYRWPTAQAPRVEHRGRNLRIAALGRPSAANSNLSALQGGDTMATKRPRTDTVTLGVADRGNLEQWINGEYHHRWTTTADRELVERLITARAVVKADIRKAVAAMRRARLEGNRRIREYGSIPRDNVALARLSEAIEDLAYYLR